MKKPSKEQLDEYRKNGFRPQVVGCFLFEKKILFVYDDTYELWGLPQGGIDNGETFEEGTMREMTEELGADFVKDVEIGEVFAEDEIEFPPHKQGDRELKTDDGEDVHMLGKHYFFTTLQPKSRDLNIEDGEFDEYRWLNYRGALDFAETIYQRGKRRTTIAAIEALNKLGLLE